MNSDPQHLLPVGQGVAASEPKRHTFLIAAIGFLIGVIATSFWFSDRTPGRLDDARSANSAAETSQNVVTISDQQAGSYVIVDSVNVPAPGVWVAIKEMQGNNLGNVLGANRIFAAAKNVTVNLLRSSLPGQTYAVVLYRDDGGGEFDVHKNSAYVDFDSGKSIVTYFKTLP